MDVIRETGSSGRRKRTTGTTYFIIEVGDTAADNSSTVDLGQSSLLSAALRLKRCLGNIDQKSKVGTQTFVELSPLVFIHF